MALLHALGDLRVDFQESGRVGIVGKDFFHLSDNGRFDLVSRRRGCGQGVQLGIDGLNGSLGRTPKYLFDEFFPGCEVVINTAGMGLRFGRYIGQAGVAIALLREDFRRCIDDALAGCFRLGRINLVSFWASRQATFPSNELQAANRFA